MNINLDEKIINEAIQKNINDAVCKSLESWGVRDAIGKVITDK